MHVRAARRVELSLRTRKRGVKGVRSVGLRGCKTNLRVDPCATASATATERCMRRGTGARWRMHEMYHCWCAALRMLMYRAHACTRHEHHDGRSVRGALAEVEACVARWQRRGGR
eukprot:215905-Chlamydomonas_euryale.AAC.1